MLFTRLRSDPLGGAIGSSIEMTSTRYQVRDTGAAAVRDFDARDFQYEGLCVMVDAAILPPELEAAIPTAAAAMPVAALPARAGPGRRVWR